MKPKKALSVLSDFLRWRKQRNDESFCNPAVTEALDVACEVLKRSVDNGKRLPRVDAMRTPTASEMGRKGGRATGPAKARPPEHYSAISRAYWQKRRAFMNTFLAMSDREKLQLFKQHGLTGASQTATHLWVHIK